LSSIAAPGVGAGLYAALAGHHHSSAGRAFGGRRRDRRAGSGRLQAVELRAGDLLTRLTATSPDEPPFALLIASSEASIRARGWPLPDGVLADTLARLRALSPAVVGGDVYRDRLVGPRTERLLALLADWPAVTWVTKFGGPGSAAVAPGPLAESARHGFADVTVDPDGVVRRTRNCPQA
jgi:adenylate cyclase